MLIKKITTLLLCTFACHANTLSAQDSLLQNDKLLLRDYRYIEQSSPWLTQRNAAGLTLLGYGKSVAQAEVSLGRSSGHLIPANGSPSVLDANAIVEAYYRINSRTVVYGSLSYDNWSGDDMVGSVFMQPEGHYPFDIVDDSLTNAGRKHRDTYHLVGAFGYQLTDGLSVGMRMDYTSGNYAKYKDLRHKNKLMDLQFTAGLMTTSLSWLNMGANYTYHRKTESVEFSTNGKSEKVYKSLIDYGALMGLVEQFGNEGYTDKSNEMPLFEDAHGVGLQLELLPSTSARKYNEGFSLFTSISYSHATGYYGRRSPYSITYTDHDRDITEASLRLLYYPSSHASRSHLDLTYSNERLKNRANTFRSLINENGSSYYEYYDAAETGKKHWRNLQIDYTLHLRPIGEQPLWTITAGYHWQQRDITAYLYPYYRQQQLRINEWSGSITRNLLFDNSILSITARGGYQQGSGKPYKDGTFVTPSSKQPEPATMPALLNRDYEYLTASQYALGLQAKYAFIFPSTLLRTHIRAAFDYRKATDSRTTLTLALGCTF